MTETIIVDYGMGNLDSVRRALEEVGAAARIVTSPRAILDADRIVLPGVGSFREGIHNLRASGLDEVLTEQVINRKVPVLGICLGMQLMASEGKEGGGARGLDWIPAHVEKLRPVDSAERVPHVGWNEVQRRFDAPLLRGVPETSDFYFVHSYHMVLRDQSDVVAHTPYCGGLVSAVQRGNIHGVQFHPEKSQRAGFQVLANFLAMR